MVGILVGAGDGGFEGLGVGDADGCGVGVLVGCAIRVRVEHYLLQRVMIVRNKCLQTRVESINPLQLHFTSLTASVGALVGCAMKVECYHICYKET